MQFRNWLSASVISVFCAGSAWAQVTVGTPLAATPTPVLQGIPTGATIPIVIQSVPANGSQKVNSSLTTIQITFNQPMDVATFFWPIPTDVPDFPTVTGDPFWTNGNRTVVLPVALNDSTIYRIPINVNDQLIFRSVQGVPVNPGVISFQTDTNVRQDAAPASVLPPGVQTPRGRFASNTPRTGTDEVPLGPALVPTAAAPARPSAVPFAAQQRPLPKPKVSGEVKLGGPGGDLAPQSATPVPNQSRKFLRNGRVTPTPAVSPTPGN